jgi:hypothetical protein
MEQWIEGELWSVFEIVALVAPGYLIGTFAGKITNRIHANTHWRLFIKGSKEAVKAFIAHHTPRLADEYFG